MAITTAHPSYTVIAPKWKRARDAISGADSVHAAGTAYLPKLSGQSEDEYGAYVRRAGWFGATARTVDALHGLIFRKPAVVEGPYDLVEDFTMTGKTAADFAAEVARQVLEVGRVGILIDHATTDAAAVSNLAQASALGLRPYASLYAAERIINWRSARINGVMQLAMVVLSEDYETAGGDEFEIETATQYRVLKLDGGVYVQQVWREVAGAGWVIVEQTAPSMRGAVMTSIPFVIVNAEHIGADVCDPPLIDLADVNYSHYRTGADLEHGAHFTGLPTPVISGYQKTEEDEKFSIGSTTAWVFSDPQAKASYLEFTGSGLATLEKLMDRKEAQMAQLGARMLTDTAGGVESAKALEIRSSGETSVLGAIAVLVGRAITKALEIARDWSGQGGNVSCHVNSDFVLSSMDPQKLSALVQAWQSGAISHKTLFWNLKQGEMVADDVVFEDELSIIENEGPNLIAATAINASKTGAME